MAFLFRLLMFFSILLLLFALMVRFNRWNFINYRILINSGIVTCAIAVTGSFIATELKKRKEGGK